MVALVLEICVSPGSRIAVILQWRHDNKHCVDFSITSCVKSVNYTITGGVEAIGIKYSVTSDIQPQTAVGCAGRWCVSTLGTHLNFATRRRNWQCEIWASTHTCCIRRMTSGGDQGWWRRSRGGSCCQSRTLRLRAAAAGSGSSCRSWSRNWCQSKGGLQGY